MMEANETTLIERLQSHMGKADMGEVLADCRLAADELTALRERGEAITRELADFDLDPEEAGRAFVFVERVRAILSKQGGEDG